MNNAIKQGNSGSKQPEKGAGVLVERDCLLFKVAIVPWFLRILYFSANKIYAEGPALLLGVLVSCCTLGRTANAVSGVILSISETQKWLSFFLGTFLHSWLSCELKFNDNTR